jgi:PAS domain S-box-containing protein
MSHSEDDRMSTPSLEREPLPALDEVLARAEDNGSVMSDRSGASSQASTVMSTMIDAIGNLDIFEADDFGVLSDELADISDRQLLHKTVASLMLADRIMICSEYPVVIMTTDGIVQAVSPSIKRLLMFDAAELIGRNINTLMPVRIAAKHDAILSAYLDTLARKQKRISSVVGQTRPVVALNKAGREVPLFLSVSTIGGDSSDSLPGLYVGQLRNAGEEVNLRTALANAKLLETVFPFPYFETDERGMIDKFNPAAENAFGLNADIMNGKNVMVLMPDHLTLLNGKRERRTSHLRFVENYVQKVRDVGVESVESNIVFKKTRHKAVRLNASEIDSVSQTQFDIELEVNLHQNQQGEIRFRAFIRVQENFMNQDEFHMKLVRSVFPSPVAERYIREERVNGTQDISVIFVDIVGFTNMLAMTDDQVTIDILNDIWSRFAEIKKDIPNYEPIKTNYEYVVVFDPLLFEACLRVL